MEIEYIKNYNYDEDLKNIYEFLCNCPYAKELSFKNIYHFPKAYDLNTIIEENKIFYNSFFRLHDVYFNNPKIHQKTSYVIFNQIKIDPYKLPIKTSIFESGGTNYERIYYGDILYSVCTSIELPKYNIDNLIVETYAHELCHTQYAYDSYAFLDLYDEVLPIFIERLCNDFYNDNNKIAYYRLKDLKNNLSILKQKKFYNIDSIFKQQIIKYTESTLKAYMLYFIYENETNTSSKAQIIDDIQSIFDGDITLDTLLNKHNINENYKNLQLIKKYIH